MKNLVISLCVTVTGPPSAICFLNNGITDPLLPNTFPNLALSVDINTNLSTPNSSAQFATLYVPNILFFIASNGLFSINGTCLCAAAWNTSFGEYFSKTFLSLSLSLTLPTIASIFVFG